MREEGVGDKDHLSTNGRLLLFQMETEKTTEAVLQLSRTGLAQDSEAEPCPVGSQQSDNLHAVCDAKLEEKPGYEKRRYEEFREHRRDASHNSGSNRRPHDGERVINR